MSYTTFHKIRQLDSGDFIVTTKCSNDSAPPHEWTMEYYKKEFPTYNNRQREAALILSGLYSSDVYYPERYKRLQGMADKYSHKLFEETGEYPYPIYGGLSREGYERDKKWYEEHDANVPEKYTLFSSYEEYANWVHNWNLKMVDGFIAYVDEQEPEVKISAKIRLNNGDWVTYLTSNSRKRATSKLESDAKIFKRTRSEIEILMKRIERYKPVLEVV